jgi:hypothetical protein
MKIADGEHALPEARDQHEPRTTALLLAEILVRRVDTVNRGWDPHEVWRTRVKPTPARER